ncbi:MAG: S41 family peptidase [Bacteroidales bacterium]|nr:S41 family peptidase [Bacteroidales bacterium]
MKKTSALCLITALLTLVYIPADAQKTPAKPQESKNFKLGQWIETQNSILGELYRSYVDTLDLKRYFTAGITSALESLDPYTVYVPEEENEDFEMLISKTYGGIGAIISKKVGEYLIIDEPYYNSPAQRAGLQSGDRIIEVDGVDVKPFTSEETTSRMKGKPGTKVEFKIKKVHTGEIKNVVITREKIHLPDVSCYTVLDNKTGYISQTGFTTGVSGDVREAFLDLKKKGIERLILDLRGNGGGLLNEAVDIVSLFVPKGSLIVTSKGRDAENTKEYRTHREPVDTEIPIMVLIDGGSASASEIVAGSLQDLDRATIAGTKSYGKGLVQSIRSLPYGAQLKVTTAHYYTPSGRCVQRLDYSSGATHAKDFADSLKQEFKTVGGRTVTSAGGITPDIVLEAEKYSRASYILVYAGVTSRYALNYVSSHPEIRPVENFHLTEQEWNEFADYAIEQDFDYRPESLVAFEALKKEIKEDGYDEVTASQVEALEKALNVSKRQMVEIVKNEIIPIIESEIIKRSYSQSLASIHLLGVDVQLHNALKADWIF